MRNFVGFTLASGTTRVILLPDNDLESARTAQAAAAQRQSPDTLFGIERCPSGAKDWAELVQPLLSKSAA